MAKDYVSFLVVDVRKAEAAMSDFDEDIVGANGSTAGAFDDLAAFGALVDLEVDHVLS